MKRRAQFAVLMLGLLAVWKVTDYELPTLPPMPRGPSLPTEKTIVFTDGLYTFDLDATEAVVTSIRCATREYITNWTGDVQ